MAEPAPLSRSNLNVILIYLYLNLRVFMYSVLQTTYGTIRATKITRQSCCPYLNLIFTHQFALAVHNFKNIMQCTRPIYYLIPTHVNKLANTNRTRIPLRPTLYHLSIAAEEQRPTQSQLGNGIIEESLGALPFFIISQGQCVGANPS